MGFPGGSVVMNLPTNAGDVSSIPKSLATKQQQPTTESTTEIKDFTPVAQIKRSGESQRKF